MARAQFETSSAEKTEAVGAALAAALEPGDVVLIEGDIGSGKTTLVRGACRSLGITENILSPTFVIGRRYRGRLPVSHVDLYRLETLDGEDPTLLSDYLTADAVTFVEWPDRADAPEFGAVTLSLRIEHAGGDRRRICGSGDDRLIEALG